MAGFVCPICRVETTRACRDHALAGVEIIADPAERKVRFRIFFGSGGTFCGSLPATEALAVADELARRANEASI